MCNCGKNGIKIENQKVLTHDSEWGWELVEDAIFCPFCGENLQPERSKREDLDIKLVFREIDYSKVPKEKLELAKKICQETQDTSKMRCSELYGNIERDK